jgi:cardiolipin synthase
VTTAVPRGAVPIANVDILEHAERLIRGPVAISDLAMAFEHNAADSTELLVEGATFYPRMLADIAAATTSVHINQFGFKPGAIGDAFAAALAEKAEAGVSVRLVVDGRGSDPDDGSRDMYAALSRAGAEIVVVRATKVRVRSGTVGAPGPMRSNLDGLGHFDHRKMMVLDGRIGWIGGAGIEDHFHDGRFFDVFVRVTGPVVQQMQLVFLASFRWLGGRVALDELHSLFPPIDRAGDAVPAVFLHNAPGRYRPITAAIVEIIEGAQRTLDISNPYVSDRRMIRRIAEAARRDVRVRLFVPANANNWACAGAQQHHHAALLDAGVRIVEYPAMLHAKAFVRDGEDVLIGTCNLDAWSLKRFLEVDIRVRSPLLAGQFEDRFAAPVERVSGEGRRLVGAKRRAKAAALAAISPLL